MVNYPEIFRNHFYTTRIDVAHHSLSWSDSFENPILLLVCESDKPQGVVCRDLRREHLVIDPRGYTMNFVNSGRFNFNLMMDK